MTGQYSINGKDCFTTWGITFQAGCVEALLKPPAAKPYTMNSSRTQAGVKVSFKNPQPEARTVVLNIAIKGTSIADYISKQENFINEINKGAFTLSATVLGRTYTMLYRDCTLKIPNYRSFHGIFRLELFEPEPNAF